MAFFDRKIFAYNIEKANLVQLTPSRNKGYYPYSPMKENIRKPAPRSRNERILTYTHFVYR